MLGFIMKMAFDVDNLDVIRRRIAPSIRLSYTRHGADGWALVLISSRHLLSD